MYFPFNVYESYPFSFDGGVNDDMKNNFVFILDFSFESGEERFPNRYGADCVVECWKSNRVILLVSDLFSTFNIITRID